MVWGDGADWSKLPRVDVCACCYCLLPLAWMDVFLFPVTLSLPLLCMYTAKS